MYFLLLWVRCLPITKLSNSCRIVYALIPSSWWKVSPCSSLKKSISRFSKKKYRWEWTEWIFKDMLYSNFSILDIVNELTEFLLFILPDKNLTGVNDLDAACLFRFYFSFKFVSFSSSLFLSAVQWRLFLSV